MKVWLAVGAILVVVVVGFVAWRVAAARLRADVSAGWASPLRCVNTRIVERADGESESRVPLVRATPHLRCTATFRIRNDGWRGVEIKSLQLPFFGPGTGGSLRAYGPAESYFMARRDALFHIDRSLSAHSSMIVSYRLRFWPGGCTGTRTSVALFDLPDVTVSALGISGSRKGDASLGWLGTRFSHQRCN